MKEYLIGAFIGYVLALATMVLWWSMCVVTSESDKRGDYDR